MARKRQPKLVKEQDGLIWLALRLAAEKTGLTKPELARRALAGNIRFLDDQYGKPIWLLEEDIHPLRVEKFQKLSTTEPRKLRAKSPAQLERQWEKISEDRPRKSGMGPVSTHYEKVMLSNLNKKKKPND